MILVKQTKDSAEEISVSLLRQTGLKQCFFFLLLIYPSEKSHFSVSDYGKEE